MTREQALAIFLLAGIKVNATDEIVNQYWPDHPDYNDLRRQYPWWLVHTEHGTVRIGWRKRVISIDWERTSIRTHTVTTDDVTKSESMVHAYSYGKAVDYMTAWRHAAQRMKETPAG